MESIFKFYSIPKDFECDTNDFFERVIGDYPTIKFSKVELLNDPFEFIINFDLKSEKFKKYFMELYEVSEEMYDKWIANNDSGKIEIMETAYRDFLVCSFSKIKSNALMWSHYTDKHEGICVEYDKDSLIKYIKKMDEFTDDNLVRYSEIPPIITYEDEQSQYLQKTFFYKSSDWKYEEEYRIVIRGSSNNVYKEIPKNIIRKVYIGAKTPLSSVKKIIEMSDMIGFECVFCYASFDSYQLKFRKENPFEIFDPRTFGGKEL